MIRTITFLEKDYNHLQQHLFKDGNEQAAFLLCGLSDTEEEVRLLVKEVIPVEDKHIKDNHSEGIYYTSESFMPVIKKARVRDECFIMVHCHPNGFPDYSDIDDREEIKLLRYAHNRITDKYHGSLIFTNANTFIGRILTLPEETYEPITKIRILGDTYKFISSANSINFEINSPNIFDRNIRAFGNELQKILQNINVGVIGCGGTGSAVIEQLCRLGVGKITLVDDDVLEDTNITRVHGSNLSDVGTPKVVVLKNMIDNIGLGTQVVTINERLNNKNTAMKLRSCDILFSCLDFTHYARAILNQLSIFYYIPLIDMGLKFDSRDGVLNDILGRIDVITPNVSCLFCRKEINSEMIYAELKDVEEYLKLRQEGYARELPNDKVQAMPYNTLVASYAVTEMIQLLTNYNGRNKYHTLYRFIASKASDAGISNVKLDKDCICKSEYIGAGDIEPFLYMAW